jgi:hypothetical protein
MPRLPRYALVLLAGLMASVVFPAVASANACLISAVGRGEMSGISVVDPLVEVFGNESVDVALELRLGLRQVPDRDSLGSDEGGVLWCLSPDDPRCFPVDGPTEAPTLSERMPSSAAPERPRPEPHDAADPQQGSTIDQAGPSGERTRVERPPRG